MEYLGLFFNLTGLRAPFDMLRRRRQIRTMRTFSSLVISDSPQLVAHLLGVAVHYSPPLAPVARAKPSRPDPQVGGRGAEARKWELDI